MFKRSPEERVNQQQQSYLFFMKKARDFFHPHREDDEKHHQKSITNKLQDYVAEKFGKNGRRIVKFLLGLTLLAIGTIFLQHSGDQFEGKTFRTIISEERVFPLGAECKVPFLIGAKRNTGGHMVCDVLGIPLLHKKCQVMIIGHKEVDNFPNELNKFIASSEYGKCHQRLHAVVPANSSKHYAKRWRWKKDFSLKILEKEAQFYDEIRRFPKDFMLLHIDIGANTYDMVTRLLDEGQLKPCMITLTVPGPNFNIDRLIQHMKYHGWIMFSIRSWLKDAHQRIEQKKWAFQKLQEEKERKHQRPRGKRRKSRKEEDLLNECFYYDRPEGGGGLNDELVGCPDPEPLAVGLKNSPFIEVNVAGVHVDSKRYNVGFVRTACLLRKRGSYAFGDRFNVYTYKFEASEKT